MATFREIYIQRHRCTSADFNRRVFWRSLYPHALPLAAVMLLFNQDYFQADRALVSCVADATNMKRVRDEVRDYFWDSNNRGWMRRVANVRVSGQRLKNLARDYLPEGPSPIPFPPREINHPPPTGG